jgi:hypothetical protein
LEIQLTVISYPLSVNSQPTIQLPAISYKQEDRRQETEDRRQNQNQKKRIQETAGKEINRYRLSVISKP